MNLSDKKPWPYGARLLSGAIHYFRVHPAQWSDRLAKARALGLNTVETYVAWNLHEPEPGQFNFTGQADLVGFIEEAARQGLQVIVRPGPYICAEWEFGGLPAWLLRDPQMQVRCQYPPYLEAVERFYRELLPRLTPLQMTRGGPIIAMQVENEYGSYGSDQGYLRWLAELMRGCGVDVPLFTSDGPTHPMLTHGTLPDILKTANFGSEGQDAFALLRGYQPQGPATCMEFWNGWFDHWGEPHHVRNAPDAAHALREILASEGGQGHVNLYMLHGGTNFGFTSGANTDPQGKYQPTVTSYDYDAAISECGDLTPKYHAFREVLGEYTELPPLPDFPRRRIKPQTLSVQASAPLWANLDALSHGVPSALPQTMEQLGQNSGYTLYRTQVRHPVREVTLHAQAVHDRAHVYLNGAYQGTLERDGPLSLPLTLPEGECTLDLLVENLGRVNYGPYLLDRKGLLGWVKLDYTVLHGWTQFALPLQDLGGLSWQQAVSTPETPAFHRATFTLKQMGDAFLSLPDWHKGTVWVNGFHLGRYWEIGPTRTLYIPEPVLKAGENELVIFEERRVGQRIELLGEPDLGPEKDTAKGEAS